MPVQIEKETCIGCGACVGVCPVTALALNDEGKCECDEDTCIDCHACVGTCPVSAISPKEQLKQTVKSLIQEDNDYYLLFLL